MLKESPLEGVAAEARALSQETPNPLTEQNLVEEKQADDGLGDHQNLGSLQLKKTPAFLRDRRILDVIASYQWYGNPWLTLELMLAFHIIFFPSASWPVSLRLIRSLS